MDVPPGAHSFRGRAHDSAGYRGDNPNFPSYTDFTELTPRRQTRSKDSMDRITFTCATRKLYRQLEKAIKIYTSLLEGYDDDVKKIRKYADERTMEHLWFLKVEGKPDRGKRNDNGFDGNLAKMMETGSQVVECLCDVRRSDVGEYVHATPKEQRLVEKSRRLFKQVELAGDQILDLLHLSVKSEDYCKELVLEMQRLKALVEPSDKASSFDSTTGGTTNSWFTTSEDNNSQDQW